MKRIKSREGCKKAMKVQSADTFVQDCMVSQLTSPLKFHAVSSGFCGPVYF